MVQKLGDMSHLIRENDPDRFLLGLLAPAAVQSALWTLDAFNHEIAKTREVVTDTTLGLIRLQWWRDEIGKIYAGAQPSGNAIISGLARIIHEYELPKEEFETLLYAREFDLETVVPESADGLLHYADFTHTPLLRLKSKVIGSTDDVKPLAVRYAMIGLVRAVPFHAAQGRIFIPKLKLVDMKPQSDALKFMVQEVLAKTPAVPVHTHKYLRAHAKLAGLYAAQIEKAGYDPFKIKPPAFKELRVALA